MDDIDIYRSANGLIKWHGKDAAIFAAMRADAMAKTGDVDGYDVWKRIVRAVDEMLAEGGDSISNGRNSPVG